MDSLRVGIDILFRKIRAESILDYFFANLEAPRKKPLSVEVDKDVFCEQAILYSPSRFTGDEAENIFNNLCEKWLINRKALHERGRQSVFNLLPAFGQSTLLERDGEPFCKYYQFLRWNEISRDLGEDLFTCSLLAYIDAVANKERNFFSWAPIVSSDNIRIHNLLEYGLAENHFHLKGSAPHFSLSWICLMNRIANRDRDFSRFEADSRLEPELIGKFSDKIAGLYSLVKKAAYIRAYLFMLLNKLDWKETCFDAHSPYTASSKPKDGKDCDKHFPYLDLLKPGNENEFDVYITEIQGYIDLLKYEFGCRFDHSAADYTIPKNLTENNFNGNILLYGERFFLYHMFRELFTGKNKNVLKYRELFYAYLVIKAKLRQEIVQVNDRVGFKNFQKYQDRKEYFIPDGSIYQKALYYMAVNTSMANQEILSFETRITPKSTKEKMAKAIKTIDNYLDLAVFSNPYYSQVERLLQETDRAADRESNPHFYTIHFIKHSDKKFNLVSDYLLAVTPRDNVTRDRVKIQAQALVNLRKSLSPAAGRILGIDAASAEIGCRPEVFAQAFRFLKWHRLGGNYDYLKEGVENRILKLGTTYHVGEDFLDIVDGLRAIDEAIKFLALERGDRLGHALALGIDARDYYDVKQQKLILSKQDLLDNIVWLISRIRKYGISRFAGLVYDLEMRYDNLYSEIYIDRDRGTTNDIPPHTLYYESWKLRGDDPALYQEADLPVDRPALTYWERCGWNEYYPGDSENSDIRKNVKITGLYRDYHFNPAAKKKGETMTEFRIKKEYIKAVEMIQQEMQKEICERGIGIETNPSSNYLIGSFRSYDKHPIISFYNLGLTTDPEKIENCPQLFVSINTDDQGVFNTYLEKEYALMALALEKMEDDQGNKIYKKSMIYDWLDRIRRMGLEQSFIRKLSDNG